MNVRSSNGYVFRYSMVLYLNCKAAMNFIVGVITMKISKYKNKKEQKRANARKRLDDT